MTFGSSLWSKKDHLIHMESKQVVCFVFIYNLKKKAIKCKVMGLHTMQALLAIYTCLSHTCTYKHSRNTCSDWCTHRRHSLDYLNIREEHNTMRLTQRLSKQTRALSLYPLTARNSNNVTCSVFQTQLAGWLNCVIRCN